MEEIALAHPQNELLLTVPQAARALNVGRSVIYELLLAGEIASIKIGRSRRVVLASLQDFIARQLVESPREGEAA